MLLTWNQDSRPLNPVLGVIVCIESEFAVKKYQIRPPEAKNQDKKNSESFEKMFLIRFSLFCCFNRIMGLFLFLVSLKDLRAETLPEGRGALELLCAP